MEQYLDIYELSIERLDEDADLIMVESLSSSSSESERCPVALDKKREGKYLASGGSLSFLGPSLDPQKKVK